ncbi:hypothetical protein BRADI_2g07586v3 [Brachypodium distachyon]|uniref:Uncharacterized protein n=1 Tax=Brachypodium distachyon TaxID=15368 RepID=A0A2K2D7E2_BRADI|nr:hypothetical protein BRADI_2g07586v3 [Brachypodium distachyon]
MSLAPAVDGGGGCHRPPSRAHHRGASNATVTAFEHKHVDVAEPADLLHGVYDGGGERWHPHVIFFKFLETTDVVFFQMLSKYSYTIHITKSASGFSQTTGPNSLFCWASIFSIESYRRNPNKRSLYLRRRRKLISQSMIMRC